MRKARKGFTLVELLIVVAILGTLAAVMTVSSGSSMAKSKATTIANNLRICSTAAQLYYLEHGDEADETSGIESVSASTLLTAKVPNWADFGTDSGGLIAYAAEGSGPANWAVTVTINGNDKSDIETALGKISGFKGAASPVKFMLFDGKLGTSTTPNPDPDPDPDPDTSNP